jgi:hypothetical protein
MKVIIYVDPKENKHVKSRLLGDHRTEPLLPIHLPRNVVLKTSITCLGKCGDAPFSWKTVVPERSFSSEERESFIACPGKHVRCVFQTDKWPILEQEECNGATW